jgi:hypothetical protein
MGILKIRSLAIGTKQKDNTGLFLKKTYARIVQVLWAHAMFRGVQVRVRSTLGGIFRLCRFLQKVSYILHCRSSDDDNKHAAHLHLGLGHGGPTSTNTASANTAAAGRKS